MKKNGMKGMNGMTHGMKAIGPMKICNTWMNMDICRRKEKDKERKGKKGKKGKVDEGKGGTPGDGKGKSSYVQLQTSSTPALQNQQQQAHYSSAASSSGHGFLAFAEADLARVDV